MVFLVVMYNCESWTIKKADHQKINVFKLWCWRRLLRVPWTARKSNESVLKEINSEYSLERLTLNSNTLATWGEESTHWKRTWCWERLKAGGEGDDREWGGWMASLTWWARVWVSSKRQWMDREAWRAAVHGFAKSQRWLSNWTKLRVQREKVKVHSLLRPDTPLQHSLDQIMPQDQPAFYSWEIGTTNTISWW